MSDCMHFPDTVEEFMEQYKMTDAKQVYSNGTEYVPIFRMEQWFEHEKTQLSCEGTTSDLISRTETAEHLRRVLEATVPNTDYDEGYIDGIEFGISTVSTMPTIQPQSTAGQPNDGVRSTARSTDLIDRQQTLDALIGAVKKVGILDADDIKAVFDMLPTIQPIATDTNVGDTISRQAVIDAVEEQLDYLQMLNKDENPEAESKWYGVNWARNTIADLPSAQPERKTGKWIEGGIYRGIIECNCSECGQLMTTAAAVRMNYCPNCGARMIKGGEPDV